MFSEILNRPHQTCFTVSKHAKSEVAWAAKKLAHDACCVIMIYVASWLRPAKSAHAKLAFENGIVLIYRDPIASLKLNISVGARIGLTPLGIIFLDILNLRSGIFPIPPPHVIALGLTKERH